MTIISIFFAVLIMVILLGGLVTTIIIDWLFQKNKLKRKPYVVFGDQEIDKEIHRLKNETNTIKDINLKRK